MDQVKLIALYVLTIPSCLLAQVHPRTSQYTVGPSVQPLVIIGEGWTQQFVIVNVDYYEKTPTVGTLSFFTADGKPWKIPLVGLGNVSQVPVNLGSGQMMILETQLFTSPQQLGWANLDISLAPGQNGIYNAYTIFRNQQNGRPDLLANANFVDGLEDNWILPFDNTQGKYPGIGIVNTNPFGAVERYTLRVYDLSGVLLKTITKTVPAMSLDWFSLLAENPDLAERRGQIKVTGGFADSAVFSLQFTLNAAFTDVPVISTFGLQ